VSATSNRLSLADLSFDPAGDACQEAKAKYRLGRGYNPGDVKACVAKPPKSQLSRLSQSDVASFTTAQPPRTPPLSPQWAGFSLRALLAEALPPNRPTLLTRRPEPAPAAFLESGSGHWERGIDARLQPKGLLS
jgi:hypothetical protein